MTITKHVIEGLEPAGNNFVDIASVVRTAGEGILISVTANNFQGGSVDDITGAVWDPSGDNQAFTLLQSGAVSGAKTAFLWIAAPTSVKTGVVRLLFGGVNNGYVRANRAHITGHDPAVGVTASTNVVPTTAFVYGSPFSSVIASSVNDRVFDMLLLASSPTAINSAGTGQTEFYTGSTVGDNSFVFGTSSKAGAASVTTSWNLAQTETNPAVARLYSASIRMLASADTTPPTVTSAAVANGTPSVVNLTMSEAMDAGSVPAASAFTVGGHTVSSVAISGNTISLTLATPFVNGEAARTVAYVQPGSNPARDTATTPNLLASFSGQAITNNVAAPGDTTAPSLSTAQVLNSAPTQIVLTFNETLAAFTPAASAFAVSGGKTVSSVARSGAQLTLTCSAAYAFGDSITVTYTKPGSNQIQDAAGNQTNSFGPSAVTNNISGGSAKTYTSTKAMKRVNGTVAAGVSLSAIVSLLDGTYLGTKTGVITSSGGIPAPFTAAFGTTGTATRIVWIEESAPTNPAPTENVTPT